MSAQGKLCVPDSPEPLALGTHRHTLTATSDATASELWAGPWNLGVDRTRELLQPMPQQPEGDTGIEGLGMSQLPTGPLANIFPQGRANVRGVMVTPH